MGVVAFKGEKGAPLPSWVVVGILVIAPSVHRAESTVALYLLFIVFPN